MPPFPQNPPTLTTVAPGIKPSFSFSQRTVKNGFGAGGTSGPQRPTEGQLWPRAYPPTP